MLSTGVCDLFPVAVTGVINGEPLHIDYSVIAKGFNEVMNGHAQGALLNLVLLALVCWLAMLLIRRYLAREEQKTVEKWRQVETIKPDYQYQVQGQKRQWVRVPATGEFQFWLLDGRGEREGPIRREKILDLSAGGMAFYTDQPLTIDQKIKVRLDLGKPPVLELPARVVRMQPGPEGEKPKMIGVQFLDIRSGEQDRIVKWTMSRQRQAIEEMKRAQEEVPCPVCGRPLPRNEAGETQPCPYCAGEEWKEENQEQE